MNIISQAEIELTEKNGNCYVVYNYFEQSIKGGVATKEEKSAWVRTPFKSIEQFNQQHKTNLSKTMKLPMPLLPLSSMIKTVNHCFIFSFLHLLFYIKRNLRAGKDKNKAIQDALQLITNAMFPVMLIEYKQNNNIIPLGKKLNSINYGASCIAQIVDNKNRNVLVEVSAKEKSGYIGILLEPACIGYNRYPVHSAIKLNEKISKIIKIEMVTKPKLDRNQTPYE